MALRKDWKVNRFRDAIISTFNSSDLKKMILCSEFFQENKYINQISSNVENSEIYTKETT